MSNICLKPNIIDVSYVISHFCTFWRFIYPTFKNCLARCGRYGLTRNINEDVRTELYFERAPKSDDLV